MVHCDNMGTNGTSSSTDCTSIGGGMATCNTTGARQPTPDMSHPQTNGTALGFIGDMIARSQERGFQRRIRQMLAAGDCQGAANLAFAHQRFDMSNQIRRSCGVSSAPADGTITAEQFMAGQPAPSAAPFDTNQPYTTEPAPSQDGQHLAAFDLLCQGTETRISKAGVQEAAFTRSFRLDLASGRYCDGECATTRPIFRVEETKITFYDTYGQTGRGSEQSVNRENGELFEGHIGVDGTTTASARCERRPFSGFPARQF